MELIIISALLMAVLTALFGFRGFLVGLCQFVVTTFTVLWKAIEVADAVLTIMDILSLIFDVLSFIGQILSLFS